MSDTDSSFDSEDDYDINQHVQQALQIAKSIKKRYQEIQPIKQSKLQEAYNDDSDNDVDNHIEEPGARAEVLHQQLIYDPSNDQIRNELISLLSSMVKQGIMTNYQKNKILKTCS